MTRRLHDFFFAGYGAHSLGLWRIWLGLTITYYAMGQFQSLQKMKVSGAEFYFIDPIWYFELLGITTNVPWINFAVMGVLCASGLAVALGYRTRASIVIFMLSIMYLKGVRDSLSGDVHHRLLIPFHFLFLLLLSRAGDVLSLDQRQGRGGAILERWEASWPIRAMQVYCVDFYFVGGLSKIRVSGIAWFGGERIQQLLISRSIGKGFEPGDDFWRDLGWSMAQSFEVCQILGASTFVMELGIPLIFFVSIWWRFAALLGISLFHLANYLLAGVQFLFMPLMFVGFFDLEKIVPAAIRERLAEATAPRS